jgi:ketosteroid isomerase-like protein
MGQKHWIVVAGLVLILATFGGVPVARAQQASSSSEIPLQRCDRLPVVLVEVDHAQMRFLVDTAATSMLNLKSFSTGRSKQVEIASWNGTKEANAREVLIPEMRLGNRRLLDVKLPAIDLSAIAKACGGPIDGIFGVDLLEQMNVTIDLKRSVAHLGLLPPSPAELATIRDMGQAMNACSVAYNAGDADQLAECFDSDFVLISPEGEFHGRESARLHFRDDFSSMGPGLRLSMTMKDQQAVGDVVWSSYDYTLESSSVHFAGHGMMLCRKEADRWYILSIHESAADSGTIRSR